MTKWFHECSLDWLKARQKCLTATDVKELLPVTRTGRKRTITDENYLKVFAGKLVNLTEDDCLSTGAAARGHILEPYAIDLYNKEGFGGSEHLWHWDDVVITKTEHVPFGLAFSPDAMDIIMDYEIRRSNQRVFSDLYSPVHTIGEVKSYSHERHTLCGYTPKEDLEERWQIATAMAVRPTIDNAYLLFYNPSMGNQLYIVDYDRSDLADEIEMVLEVEKNWLAWIADLSKLDKHLLISGDAEAEQAIIDEIMKREELNPECERSVIR